MKEKTEYKILEPTGNQVRDQIDPTTSEITLSIIVSKSTIIRQRL